MGQKVHPYGFRLGIIRDTRSRWFAEGQDYRDQLVEDLQARKMIHERHHHAGISDILIERAAGTATVTIESAKPGIIIGRGGSDVDRLRRDLDTIMSGRVRVNVEETKMPERNAQLIAEEIASQIERRASIRRAMSQAIERAVRVGVDGIRVAVSGRLMGAEIARTERMGPVGSVPLHTLRADVDRGFSEASTGYGHIGVQVFVCNGEILPPPPSPPEGQRAALEAEAEAERAQQDADLTAVEAEASEAPADGEQRTIEETVEAPAVETVGGVEVAEMDELLAESGSEEAATVSASTQQAAAPVETEAATEPPADEPAQSESETSAEEDAGDVDA
ncbi:MAG: 30S ribosomal protein S3 [candidate division WS1 bacterium]|jgi:small subunit ribosomal protein S3|nr:30S ribosomal protein S3 [candidate division WS1 bacterium]